MEFDISRRVRSSNFYIQIDSLAKVRYVPSPSRNVGKRRKIEQCTKSLNKDKKPRNDIEEHH
jgi:hypothetical protein